MLRLPGFALAALCCAACAIGQEADLENSLSDQLSKSAISTLEEFCLDCHVGDDAEGGIQVDFLTEAGSLARNVETIEKIVRVLEERQMPPVDAEQPDSQQRIQLTEWIETRLATFDCGSISGPGRVTMRRLNRVEYDNTVRDLTGLSLKLADSFPSDDVGNGFDNIGDVLTIPPILLEKYLDAASEIGRQVVGDQDALKRVFPRVASDPENLEEVLEVTKDNVNTFMNRAFRRYVAEEESDRVVQLMVRSWQNGSDPEALQQLAIAAVLSSPHFIYKTESHSPEDFVDGVRALNDYEIASRLSYFLWSTMPDDQLLELASQRKLHTAEQIEAEVERMLQDEKAEALVANFAGQWLQLRDLESLSPDPELFPTDKELIRAMRRETELLFGEIIRSNESILDLLDADYSFLNERLAKHYGVEGVTGDAFQQVSLTGNRRGVLTHASILLITSNPTRTSPVKRGKWVLDNLLGEPPPPPPPDVPELEEGGETLGTLRQQMEQHRANPNCSVCHTKMDALGFGLENFDAIGKWREKDGRNRIDPSGALPGGRSFSGPVELVKILADDKKDAFSRCVTEKLLTYALGRGLGLHDRCTLKTILATASSDNYRFATLVKAIVTSPPFLYQESGL